MIFFYSPIEVVVFVDFVVTIFVTTGVVGVGGMRMVAFFQKNFKLATNPLKENGGFCDPVLIENQLIPLTNFEGKGFPQWIKNVIFLIFRKFFK